VKRRLLVVDDDAAVVDYLCEALRNAGYAVTGVESAGEALRLIEAADFDLLISDVEMPEMRGPDLLAAVQTRRPGMLVLLITAFGSIESAVQAVRAGACDFVAKPFQIEVLLLAIERALRERQMRREIVRLRASVPGAADGELVARSRAMQKILDLARRAADSTAPVLLTGDSGTGKGAVARYIHDNGARARHPFVHVNCAALPAALVESELFGVRRGAFTDAREDRTGLYLEASGGTLFFDEIGEMPLETQPKLLHTLETGRVRPLGAAADLGVDARLISATNRPLENALRERRFRPDLYYRLNVIRIEIPPLRERREDIEPLIDVFLGRIGEKTGHPVLGVTGEAMRWLVAHPWPGNVRELANTLERAVALTDHDTLVLDDLVVVADGNAAQGLLDDAASRGMPLAEVERSYIRRVLDANDGNKARAARILGIDRRTLYRKLNEEEPSES
jgi:DNA-binding NtrC family response regulator